MNTSVRLMAGVCLGALAASNCWAQSAELPQTAPNSASVEEVAVTAQKRSERLQEVPLSVTAVKADALVQENLTSIEDYSRRIPSLVVQGPLSADITIRGISSPGTNPTVATTVDDVPFGSSFVVSQSPNPDLDPSELSQIEVLRGPQGTLYGANSLGGLIKYVTIQPDTHDFSGRLQVGGETVAHGDTGYSARGAVNMPLAEDKAAIRVSGFYRHEPGYIDNARLGLENVNDAKAYGGRVALLLKPTDNMSVTLSALMQKRLYNDPSTVDLNPDYTPVTDDLSHSTPALGSGYQLVRLFEGRLDADLEFATATSLTSWGEGRSLDNQDYTATLGAILPLFGFPPDTTVPYSQTARNDKFTQEIRLTSPTGGQVEWLVGGFYTHESNQILQIINAEEGGAVLANLITADLPITYQEIAAFGSFTYKFSSAFDIQAGARYAENRQSFGFNVSGLLQGPPVNVLGRSKEDTFTWQVTPRYHFNPDTMGYFRLATGYRPGGPNTALPGNPPTFGSDTTTNYELGLKGSLFDKLLSYDAALYWIDWKDIQLNLTNPGTGLTYFGNGGKARSRGIEASAQLHPGGGVTLAGNVSWNDAELREDLPANSAIGFAGDRLPYQPRFSGNLSAEKAFALPHDLTGRVGATLTYVGERRGAFQPNATDRIRLRAFTTLDLNAGVQSEHGLSVSLYARNITDERGWATGDLRTAGFAAAGHSVTVIQPRTFGVLIAQDF